MEEQANQNNQDQLNNSQPQSQMFSNKPIRPLISKKIIIALVVISIFSLAYSGIYVSLSSKLDKIIRPKQGVLSGKLTIGPICPVEPCDSTQNPYLGRTIVLESKTGNLISVSIKEDGSFSKELSPETYTLNLNKCEHLGCTEALPKTVTIETNKTTEVNIDIDTGIR